MSIADARQSIATALSSLDLNVRPRPIQTPKKLDGWVSISKIEPSGYGQSKITFSAIIVLGADAPYAEGLMETIGVDALNVLADLPLYGLSAEPEFLSNPGLYALVITATMEV